MKLTDFVSSLDLMNQFAKKVKEKALSHAYLFVSDDDELRKEFCFSLTALILGNQPQVYAQTHPDFKLILSNKNILVDQVAPIVSDVYLTPLEAEFKVYLIDDASMLTPEAQNKLLKTIEEPPKNSIVILAASKTEPILQTILSRVLKFDLPKLSDEVLKEILAEEDQLTKNAEIYISGADGNLTKLHAILNDNEYLNLYNQAFEVFKLKSSKEILNLVSKINVQKISLTSFFSLTNSFARDIMVILAGKPELVKNKAKINELLTLSQEFNLNSITKIIDEINRFCKDLFFNANQQSVLDQFLFKIVEVKVTCKK